MDKTYLPILLCLLFILPGEAAAPLTLQSVYRLKSSQRLVIEEDLAYDKRLKDEFHSIAFRAVCTNYWHAGLVPVFLVEKSNRFELRRLPQRGRENASDPLFFALPRKDETAGTLLPGRWDCQAIRSSGSKEWFGMELTVDGTNVAGRFDQNTDFRFAFIMGGTFVSNALALRVEYNNEAYNLVAPIEGRKMSGRWRRLDGSEDGPWEGERTPAISLPEGDTVELFEWHRKNDGLRTYLLADQDAGKEWTRVSLPICRVWPGIKAEGGALRAPPSIPQTPANPQRK